MPKEWHAFQSALDPLQLAAASSLPSSCHPQHTHAEEQRLAVTGTQRSCFCTVPACAGVCPCRVFCGHSDWVEGVLVCPAKDNAYDQSFLSFSADGHVACWELDAEQNCDIFRQVVSVHTCVGAVCKCLAGCSCSWPPAHRELHEQNWCNWDKNPLCRPSSESHALTL
jgi:hypothetical protein